MTAAERRRSARLNTHDSNGRDHLADLMPGWTRGKLEAWVTSETVRPHLQLWYQLCIASRRRFNCVVEWINTGEGGYFYNPSDLEEDLLLACLGEGAAEGDEDSGESRTSVYADTETNTAKWVTQELWARTVWRVVTANSGPDQAFEHMFNERPAACYSFVIELLCIAFHSIAFRDKASCYEWLINGPPSRVKKVDSTILEQVERDEQQTESDTSDETESASGDSTDHSSDLDFEVSRRRRDLHRHRICKPKVKYDGSSMGAFVVRKWIAEQRAEITQQGDKLRPPSEGDNIIVGMQAVTGDHGTPLNHATNEPCETLPSPPYSSADHKDTTANDGKPRVRCSKCPEERTFSRTDQLTRHMRNHHPEDLILKEDNVQNGRKQRFRCPICREEKTFARCDGLTRHMRSSHPEVKGFGRGASVACVVLED